MTFLTLKLCLAVPSKEKINSAKPSSVAKKRVRIMAFGTFDIVHPGHKHFFQQARALAGKHKPFLIVSLARDKNVVRIKGRPATSNELKRLARVKTVSEVDKAVLGAIGNHIPHIVKEKPEIIALGYDQSAYVGGLRSALAKAGLKVKVVRMKPHLQNKYKTSIIKKNKSKKSQK